MCECPQLQTLIETSKIHHQAQSAAMEEIKDNIEKIAAAAKAEREDVIRLKSEFNIFKGAIIALCLAVCGEAIALIFEFFKR